MAEIFKKIENWLPPLLLFIAVTVPIFIPISIPLTVSGDVKILKEDIDALPAGSIAIIDVAIGAAGYPEIGPGVVAAARQLAARNIRIVFTPKSGPSELPIIEQIIVEAGLKKKTYGTDYVNLGYFAFVGDSESFLVKIGEDLHASVVDYYGNTVSTLPLMQEVYSMNDVDAVFIVSKTQGIEQIIRQWTIVYNVPSYLITGATWREIYRPYRDAGLLLSNIGGPAQMAQYEFYSGFPGSAQELVGQTSLAFILCLAFIILGNVKYWYDRKLKTKEVKANV